MKILTLARDLRRRKAREKHELFVAEGLRAVEELLRSPLEVRGALIGPQISDNPRRARLLDQIRQRGIPTDEVGAKEFESASDTETPQGLLALGVVPERRLAELPVEATLRLVVLDAIQDPGNVGTIILTAAALGATATLALPGTVDLWNAKVVRSAMGAHFNHPCLHCTWDELRTFLDSANVPLWGA